MGSFSCQWLDNSIGHWCQIPVFTALQQKPQFNFYRKTCQTGVIQIHPRGFKLTKRVTFREACFQMLVAFIILLNGCSFICSFYSPEETSAISNSAEADDTFIGKLFADFPVGTFLLHILWGMTNLEVDS